jgi:hypothetical protein
MPKTDIDYSSTIIYKITCKDASVNEVYVGHTTNFVQRKYAHKQSCINEKNTNYKCKLYEVIRALGGWANWKMEIVGFFNCANHNEARQKEQEFFISLKATLNSIEPYPIPKIKIYKKDVNEVSIINDKHQISKISKINECKLCDYICYKKSEYEKHLATSKHINANNANNAIEKNLDKKHSCCCGKLFNHTSSLSRHKLKCKNKEIPNCNYYVKNMDIDNNIETCNDTSDIKTLTNLVIELVKSNTDLQKQMLELCKNSNTTINNNTNTKNSHNKTFNMQIFLNEHCKDAMNIKDFADSFKLEISDFEKVGHLGYVDGISDIIIKKLNEMDVHKRPIHCSDTKRDIMYVHADNVWTKENSDHGQVRLLVQRITAKNIRLIPIWQDLYPNSRNNMHKLNDTYMSLTRQAMGGFGGTIPENETKIIRKIAKSVFIDKNM